MWERPTLQEIIDRIDADFQTRISGASTFLRRSVLKIMGRVYAGAVHLLYGNIDFNKDQLFVTTANAEYLAQHASEYGITKTGATKAVGTGTATGTTGISIPARTELQSVAGVIYKTDAVVTLVAGTGILALTAKEIGESGNDDGGVVLSFISPITGIDSTVTVSSAGLTGGTDEETDEALRNRVLTRKRQPPHGGADFDYVVWMKEVSGVTRAWAISQYQGIGTVGCVFVQDDNDSIIPSETEINTVKDYIISHSDPITGLTIGIPTTAEAGLFMITPVELSINLTINIYPNTAAVQAAITSKIEDLIYEYGAPEQTIYLSQIQAAISAATDEERHTLVYPVTDVSASATQIPGLGTITFGDYGG